MNHRKSINIMYNQEKEFKEIKKELKEVQKTPILI